MKKSETKPNCKFYMWGNGIYPREYGARCNKFNKFFFIDNGVLEPQCWGCKEYLKEDEG